MSDSNNITVLNPGLYKNLLAQVEPIYRHSNELSFKTRARYYEATKRFCKFLADNFRLQNFKNVEDRHFKHYLTRCSASVRRIREQQQDIKPKAITY